MYLTVHNGYPPTLLERTAPSFFEPESVPDRFFFLRFLRFPHDQRISGGILKNREELGRAASRDLIETYYVFTWVRLR